MFRRNNQSKKAPEPSIWSVDSGYASYFSQEDEQSHIDAIASPSNPIYPSSRASTKGLQLKEDENGDLRLASSWNLPLTDQVRLNREKPTVEPIVTKLSVFTIRDSTRTENDFVLPEISNDNAECITCEFWKITNPEENMQCENCRIPEIVEPSCLVANGVQGKEPELPPHRTKKAKGKMALIPTSSTRCSACELSALIDPSAPAGCSSCDPSSQYLSPTSPTSPSSLDFKVKRSRAGRNSKLPLSALNRLQAWLDANQDNPYPSAEVKRQLAQECGITEKQVTTWFTNARARQLNPMENWLSSGSEDDGARESDIASAAETPAYTGGFAFLSDRPYRRAGSVSGSSAFSQPGPNRPAPSRRGKKKDYRRSNQPPQITEHMSTIQSAASLSPGNRKIYQDTWQCTFCYRHLVPKSWRRHEETQHRPRAQWTCMLFGPRLSFPHRAGSCCAFCMAKDPSEEHFLKNHRISECAKRPIGERTFLRPDHLRQHVKNFHGATLFDIAQCRWKRAAESTGGGWTCGFCGDHLGTWDKRETHIANHFKEGMTIDQWQTYPDHDTSLESEDSSPLNTSKVPQGAFPNSYDTQPSLGAFSTCSPYIHSAGTPILPSINLDPFIDTAGYTDWSQPIDSQFPVSDSSPNAVSQAAFNSALNNVLNGDYGNIINPLNPWSSS
ncbi:hypothetical protein K469DRAFT_211940 [Zopfia rhizophila CBS 207.26]|uniref:Homeobox domain-containing protein n=1 Tax=Zopfia rhizophila CBS 207.26 TaxID=1314779 RepID=A0A6A6DVF4_9PEZI|nr:hypothetical protein K469DRAFT_211940 [Zopfia rhizophila CBS 207.26]